MLDIPSASAIVAAAGVLIGVVLAVFQLRDFVKTRQTDLIMRLYSHFGSKEIQEAYFAIRTMEFKDYNEYMKKYGPPTGPTLAQVCMFFNGIGVLLQKKLVDAELVDILFGAEI